MQRLQVAFQLGQTKESCRVATAMLAAAAIAAPPTGAAAGQLECTSDGAAWQITADCVDPQYTTFEIDSDTSPIPHRRVDGHFAGTDIKVSIYLPPADRFEGRFFQYTYPLTGADADQRAIGFAFESGGYAVQAGNDGISLGYRHAAYFSAAKAAEKYAAEYYDGDGDIYGYLYGPSGGSYQTIGAAENTTGVWDRFVPMVQGVPLSNPYTFTIRAAAELIRGDKAEPICRLHGFVHVSIADLIEHITHSPPARHDV